MDQQQLAKQRQANFDSLIKDIQDTHICIGAVPNGISNAMVTRRSTTPIYWSNNLDAKLEEVALAAEDLSLASSKTANELDDLKEAAREDIVNLSTRLSMIECTLSTILTKLDIVIQDSINARCEENAEKNLGKYGLSS